MKQNKLKLSVIILLGLGLTSVNVVAQKIKANNPIPPEFVGKIDSISLKRDVKVLDPKFLISTSTHNAALLVGPVVGIAVIQMAKSVLKKLESDIAEAIPPEKDTVLLSNTAYEAFYKVLTQKNSELSTDNSKADFVLNVSVIDHGFHWATSSALGVYIRLKVELLSSAGDILWEQFYYMNKKEKKQPHNRKAINVKRCVDALLADYENNPDLLEETYELICRILASKLIPTQK